MVRDLPCVSPPPTYTSSPSLEPARVSQTLKATRLGRRLVRLEAITLSPKLPGNAGLCQAVRLPRLGRVLGEGDSILSGPPALPAIPLPCHIVDCDSCGYSVAVQYYYGEISHVCGWSG